MWVAMRDEVLLALLALLPHHTALPLLYFSTAIYEQAIRQLRPEEVAEVIRQRLAQWAPRALDDSLDWLYRRERRCLTLTALARAVTGAGGAAILEAHFGHTLELLT